MAQAKSPEELIFEKKPYVEAAKAITVGDIAALERLIRDGLDVNYEGNEVETEWGLDTLTLPLWAFLQDSPKSIEALLKAGADPNKSTRRGVTLLMAAALGKSDELFELLLIGYKADPNKIYDGGVKHSTLTLVLTGPQLGEKRWQRAVTLVRHGAELNLNLDRGATAIIQLATLEYWRAVLWLLEHGADHEVRNRLNATMMCYMRDSYESDSLKPSEEYAYRDKVRDWLLARGVARSRVDPALHPGQECDD